MDGASWQASEGELCLVGKGTTTLPIFPRIVQVRKLTNEQSKPELHQAYLA